MENNTWLILIAFVSYLLGTLPSSYIVTRKMSGRDIRSGGSGNVGAMNAFRVIRAEKSTKLATVGLLLVLLGDIGKGALVIGIARWLTFLGYDLGPALIVAGFFVVLGHNYSIFFKFKGGGRGIACLMGVLLALDVHSFFAWAGTLVAVIILAQYLLVGKMHWEKSSELISVVGSQIVGRVAGLLIALITIYFYTPQIFFPILAATCLITIRHIDRVRNYVAELRISKSQHRE